MARIAVVGYTNDWSTEELVQSLRSKGAEVTLIPPVNWSLTFPGDRATMAGMAPPEVDAWLIKDLGYGRTAGVAIMLEMLRSFQKRGAKVFPRIGAVEAAVDRYRRTLALGRAGLPIIETRFAGSIQDAVEFVQYVGTAVYKPRHSVPGEGLSLLKAEDPTLKANLQLIARQEGFPCYLQQFISGLDHDLRIVVIGGEVLGGYARIAQPGRWQTSPKAGGRHAACPMTPEISHLAQQAVEACKIAFATVELAPTPDGMLVFDVNPFAGFVGLKEACDVHAPSLLAEYVLQRV